MLCKFAQSLVRARARGSLDADARQFPGRRQRSQAAQVCTVLDMAQPIDV